jgi:drug/metabolite transporter (DMT)-like permease
VTGSRGGPVLACLVAAALFGAATPAAKLLLGSLGPFALAGMLYLGAALATLPFVFHGGSRELALKRRNLSMLLGAVVFGGVVGPVLLLVGLARAPAASVALWLNLETVATAVLAWALFREHLGARAWLAVALAVAAGVLLASPASLGLAGPAVLVALACVCWGLDNSLTALVDGFTPAQTTFVKGLVAGSFNLAVALVFESVPFEWGTLLGALGVGALGYGVSIVLYIHGAQGLGATRSQVLFSTAPFVGVVLAWLFLGEAVLGSQLWAMALLVPALWLLVGSRHEHEHSHERVTHTHRHRHDDLHHDHEHDGPTPRGWHTHEHTHEPRVHAHPHAPDLHHRHEHSRVA